jgi:uncharacterized protein YbjT (DUF2867 family)
MSTERVLVAGATGRLGGIVEVLLGRGHAVRAITRAPDSPAAARLRGLGAEVVPGDYEEPDGIAAAAAGVDAVFATGTAHRAGPDGELRHGRNLADAVAAAGVPHLVYSSGDGAAPDSPLPLFRAKFAVEEHIRSLPIRSTILAPVYFMENLLNPWNRPALAEGVFPSPISLDVPLQQIAVADLLSFAALAIERPAEFAGRRIALASDELTGRDAARTLGLRAEHTPPDAPGLHALFGWLERDGHDVDIAALRDQYPEVGWHGYAQWAQARANIPWNPNGM